MKYVLDTCVLSELVKEKPALRVLNFIERIDIESVRISVFSLAELKRGVFLLPESSKKRRLVDWLEGFELRFVKSILKFDAEQASHWAQLFTKFEKSGQKMPLMDSLIYTQCSYHQACLVTRNEKDFINRDLEVINPWI